MDSVASGFCFVFSAGADTETGIFFLFLDFDFSKDHDLSGMVKLDTQSGEKVRKMNKSSHLVFWI